MPEFLDFPLWINLALFTGAAAAVWAAGTRISRYADIISRKTGLSQALLGLLLLGGVTSLPEMAVTLSASFSGNLELAANSIFGGVAMQVAILVIADYLVGRRALTSVIPDPVVLLQGTLAIVMLSTAAAAIVVGDYPLFGVGLWSWGILALYFSAIWALSREKGHRPWLAAKEGKVDTSLLHQKKPVSGKEDSPAGLGQVLLYSAVAGSVIFAAGYVLSQTGEAIAQQTGLGSSFAGFALVAISTSLPEVSTVVSAARLGLYTMAISDIFGTNIFDIGLLFVVDAVAGGDPLFNQLDAFSAFGAMLGIAVTAIYVAGLAERSDRSVMRLGVDSIATFVVYAGGLVILFNLR